MSIPDIRRREFVAALGGAAAATWLAGHLSELRASAVYAASVPPQAPWEFFTADEAREFDAVSAQIVPTDDTPGAREAHVVRFADHWMATVQQAGQPVFRNDFTLLAELVAARTPDNHSFAVLSEADQIALLIAFEKSNPQSFGRFRGTTMLGMFSDPIHGGNFNKIGWKLNGYEDRYSWTPPFGYYDRV
jgi:gluconate 2-dehydrogenase gamma chain